MSQSVRSTITTKVVQRTARQTALAYIIEHRGAIQAIAEALGAEELSQSITATVSLKPNGRSESIYAMAFIARILPAHTLSLHEQIIVERLVDHASTLMVGHPGWHSMHAPTSVGLALHADPIRTMKRAGGEWILSHDAEGADIVAVHTFPQPDGTCHTCRLILDTLPQARSIRCDLREASDD